LHPEIQRAGGGPPEHPVAPESPEPPLLEDPLHAIAATETIPTARKRKQGARISAYGATCMPFASIPEPPKTLGKGEMSR
jgi:hypothetical protein